MASEPSAAQRIRDSIAALPDGARHSWRIGDFDGVSDVLAGDPDLPHEICACDHHAKADYIVLMAPHVGEALANLLEAIRRCLNSDPQPCDHEETDDCLTDIAERTDALEAAIKREQT
jgi:hypothetical protein